MGHIVHRFFQHVQETKSPTEDSLAPGRSPPTSECWPEVMHCGWPYSGKAAVVGGDDFFDLLLRQRPPSPEENPPRHPNQAGSRNSMNKVVV